MSIQEKLILVQEQAMSVQGKTMCIQENLYLFMEKQ